MIYIDKRSWVDFLSSVSFFETFVVVRTQWEFVVLHRIMKNDGDFLHASKTETPTYMLLKLQKPA